MARSSTRCRKVGVITGTMSSCVPLDVEILTRRGWVTYHELAVGDETPGSTSAPAWPSGRGSLTSEYLMTQKLSPRVGGSGHIPDGIGSGLLEVSLSHATTVGQT